MQETQETWVWSLGEEDPLEEGREIHSSILARRIPGCKESGTTEVTEHADTYMCIFALCILEVSLQYSCKDIIAVILYHNCF